jgi:NAD(P)-dependent dehydrogenase (short-subunit alcohol dehydrogenase family)
MPARSSSTRIALSIAAAAKRHPRGARPPRRARQQRGYLEYGQRRGARQAHPREQRVPAFAYRSIFGPVYPASKTALNAMTLAVASELESTEIKVNACSPGFTKTNPNNYAGTETVEERAREAVRLALLDPAVTFSHATSDCSRGDGAFTAHPGECMAARVVQIRHHLRGSRRLTVRA